MGGSTSAVIFLPVSPITVESCRENNQGTTTVVVLWFLPVQGLQSSQQPPTEVGVPPLLHGVDGSLCMQLASGIHAGQWKLSANLGGIPVALKMTFVTGLDCHIISEAYIT